MKLLIITPALTGGGAERVAINLANYSVSKNVETHLISIKRINHYDGFLNEKVKSRFLTNERLRFQILRLNNEIDKIKPTHILTTIRDASILLGISRILKRERWIFREASPMNGIEKMYFVKKIIYKLLIRLIYRRCDVLIANSGDTLSSLLKITKTIKKTVVIGNPIETHFTGTNMQNHDAYFDKDIILSVGRLNKVKGFDILLKAFKIVNQINKNTALIIIGQGDELDNLRILSKELGVDQSVYFLGFISNLAPFYRNAKVFVSSSRWEGFGNVIVESMSFGLPVVVTDCPGGPKDIIEFGTYGKLVPVDDYLKMSIAIIDSLSNACPKDLLIQRAGEYSIEKISKLYFKEMQM